MRFKSTHGYSPLLPLLGVVLVLTCIGSFVMALGSADWRPLIVTLLCYVILVKGSR